MSLRWIIMSPFWSGWINRFESHAETFLTPDDPAVMMESNEIDVSPSDSDIDRATKAWLHVASVIQWKLSKEWKTPRQTLSDGIGDCEDLDFLLLSILPNIGVRRADLLIGDLVKDDRPFAHTWIEVNGEIIDPTGLPKDVEEIGKEGFKEVHRFIILFGDARVKKQMEHKQGSVNNG